METTEPDLQKKLLEVLRALPTDSKEIADKLLSGGFKGIRRDSDCCPLARYLTATVGVPIEVGLASAYVAGHDVSGCDIWRRIELLGAVLQFRKDFDSGKYPELEEK